MNNNKRSQSGQAAGHFLSLKLGNKSRSKPRGITPSLSNKDLVLEQIFLRPSYKFHIREMAEVTGLNPNTIINLLCKLKKEGIVNIEKKKHIVEFFADTNNKNFLWKKRIFNLFLIYSSEIINFLVDRFEPELVSVMGSYANGEDIEKSDIDIVVISDKKEKDTDLSAFEKKLGRKIHFLVLSYKDISDEFYTNLINGVVLYGFVRKR